MNFLLKHPRIKTFLLCSLLVNVAFLFVGARHFIIISKQTAEVSFSDTWNRQRTQVFDMLKINRGDIVFVGNSLTEGFPLYELYPKNNHIKNRGITGNKTTHLLNRLMPIVKAQPAKIFIEIGINDLNEAVSVDSALINYNRIVSTIEILSPTTKVYCQSLLPTTGSYKKLNPQIQVFNSKLKTYCQKPGLMYVDLYTPMCEAGELPQGLTYDGLHLTAKGYAIWKAIIDPLISPTLP